MISLEIDSKLVPKTVISYIETKTSMSVTVKICQFLKECTKKVNVEVFEYSFLKFETFSQNNFP